MEKTSCTDCLRNEDVLHRVKKDRNMLHTVKGREGSWIGHVLRKNCLTKRVIEGEIEGKGRERRRLKQLLDGLKEIRRFWKLKEDALDRPLWKYPRTWRKSDYMTTVVLLLSCS
jgi:hypothetical protein